MVRGTLTYSIDSFGGTPSWSNRYKDQGIVIFGGTPGSAPRLGITALNHPNWPLLDPQYMKKMLFMVLSIFENRLFSQ